MVRANRDGLQKTIVTYTTKLFKNPFDEAWVADAETRATFERRMGYDMRSRPVVNQRILADFLDILAERHRFAGSKVARLGRAAMHILALDSANAVYCHSMMSADTARERTDELNRTIHSFAESIR